MFDTLLPRPSLQYNTPLHFNTLHPIALCFIRTDFFRGTVFTVFCQLTLRSKGLYWYFILKKIFDKKRLNFVPLSDVYFVFIET